MDIKQKINYSTIHFPLIEWTRINKDLNNKYKEYGILNDKYGLEVKNTARHFTGGALGNKFYGEDKTKQLGSQKEIKDIKRDIKKNKDISEIMKDVCGDIDNNNAGINFTKQNPNIDRKSVYDAAIQYAIEKHKKEIPIIEKEVYGTIIEK